MTQIIIDKIQFKRGPTSARMALVLDLAEPFYDETEQAEYIGDGVTVGGNPSAGLSGGISQGAADSRYVKIVDIGDLRGADGKDGQIRFTGHGVPGTIVGANPLDTYMDLDTGNIYQLT